MRYWSLWIRLWSESFLWVVGIVTHEPSNVYALFVLYLVNTMLTHICIRVIQKKSESAERRRTSLLSTSARGILASGLSLRGEEAMCQGKVNLSLAVSGYQTQWSTLDILNRQGIPFPQGWRPRSKSGRRVQRTREVRQIESSRSELTGTDENRKPKILVIFGRL